MTKHPLKLKEEAKQEAYEYYDKNIGKLARKKDGSFDESTGEMSNNEADAFRHAYTSGVMTREYRSKTIADLLGQGNEIRHPNPENQHNMDLWNNNVGRNYGDKIEDRKELADALKKALENGELIASPDDPRKYEGSRALLDAYKSVIVLKESATGLNEVFFDLIKGKLMSRDEFNDEIKSGNYEGYKVIEKGSVSFPVSKPDGIAANNLG